MTDNVKHIGQRSDAQSSRLTVLVMGISVISMVSGCATPRTVRVRHPGSLRNIIDLAQRAARKYRLKPAFVLGVIHVESRYKTGARSSVGARGLMQLMPKTAAGLAKQLQFRHYDLVDPQFNITAGTYYLSKLGRKFGGNLDLALAAYHTGPARVARWQRAGRPLPAYSRNYIRAVRAAETYWAAQLSRRPRVPRSPRGISQNTEQFHANKALPHELPMNQASLRQLIREKTQE